MGELRTEVTHVRSGQRFVTDAPVDNKGRGEAISPTDMLATSLATCMITTMDIVARDKGITLRDLSARVVKHMASGPRRVQRVEVHLEMDGSTLGHEERLLMEQTAHGCPVTLSLHPDLVQEVHFTYR
ncbi:MAG TPA: OsmC family protein [Flavobacteriales bacterium]|nr:OsmC family protein [Flavobacteriales bacterium]